MITDPGPQNMFEGLLLNVTYYIYIYIYEYFIYLCFNTITAITSFNQFIFLVRRLVVGVALKVLS